MATRTLLIMRHAKSSWEESGVSDRNRPLNARGNRIAPLMGRFLKDRDLVPERVLCSTANRAESTLKLLLEEWGTDVSTSLLDEYYLAAPETYLRGLVEYLSDEMCVMIVAHNPGLEHLVAHLGGRNEPFPTAAVAVVRFDGEWSEILDSEFELADIFRPKELDLDAGQ